MSLAESQNDSGDVLKYLEPKPHCISGIKTFQKGTQTSLCLDFLGDSKAQLTLKHDVKEIASVITPRNLSFPSVQFITWGWSVSIWLDQRFFSSLSVCVKAQALNIMTNTKKIGNREAIT